jgi:threonine/homoserine/homoserine lactone efflux protein
MDYLLFLLICFVATFSPGPAVLLVIKNSATYGLKKSVSGIFGNVIAMLSIATLSTAGLGVVIMASEHLYCLIKIIGGSYLIYLGIKAWTSSSKVTDTKLRENTDKRNSQLFLQAYWVGVTNPKAIAFYTALFPQFITMDQPVIPQFFILALTFAVFSFVALFSYALATTKFKNLFLKSNFHQWVNKIAGTIFIMFGISLLSSNKT